MTREDKDKLLDLMGKERNSYSEHINQEIERLYGKIEGADFILNRLLDYFHNSSTTDKETDYEIRLKADIVAILSDLQLEVEECVDGAEGSPGFEQGVANARVQVVKMIQERISDLTSKSEEANHVDKA